MDPLPPPPRFTLWLPALLACGLSALFLAVLALV